MPSARSMTAARTGGRRRPPGAGNEKPTRKELITEKGLAIVQGYINEQNLKRDGDIVYKQRDDYKWDFLGGAGLLQLRSDRSKG
eukprot:COSAG04_NODE_1701_length_5891_cov_2.394337_5_plen_84_part_00